MSAAPRPALVRLAERLGVQGQYHDLEGRLRTTQDATRERLCAAMGFACASEADASARLAELEAREQRRLLEPVQVWREHARGAPALRVRPPASLAPLDAELEFVAEDGSVTRRGLALPAGDGNALHALPLPVRPPLGYHTLRLRLARSGETHEQLLVVAPRSAWLAREALGERDALGLWANLYTVRGRRGFGFGDLGDLRALGALTARLGGDFVAINPLHALRNRGAAIAPYSPVSRVFRNPLYIDVEAVPELADCEPARAVLAALPLARLRDAAELDHGAILDAKLAVLRELHPAVERGPRADALAAWIAREGDALSDFATFEALVAARGEPDWRRWPAELSDPRSPAVRAFAAQHEGEIALHCYLQFELECQLEAAGAALREAGLALGLITDLAIGSAPDSADVWSDRALFAHGASLGAPPDAYSADGQNWGLPPLVPIQLRETRYAFVRRLLRAAFRGAGGLRVDHVMGLLRQFWIPAGRPGSEGAYVRQPFAELLGILALESRRARALVIGEDLGTVPPELGPELASFGILSTRVLCFERTGSRFRPRQAYPARALALASTHDLPPLAGYFRGRDLELRRELARGAAGDAAAALQARAEERTALVETLRDDGELAAGDAPVGERELTRAAHEFLARTPARLVALSLDDLAGETEPLNLPGVPVEAHRSWSRRMTRTLDEIGASAEAPRR